MRVAEILALLVLGCGEAREPGLPIMSIDPTAHGTPMEQGSWNSLYEVPVTGTLRIDAIRCWKPIATAPVVHEYPVYAALPAGTVLTVGVEPPTGRGINMSLYSDKTLIAGPFFVPYDDTEIQCAIYETEAEN